MPVIGKAVTRADSRFSAADIRLPVDVRSVFAAIVLGTVIDYVFGPTRSTGGTEAGPPPVDLLMGLPTPLWGSRTGSHAPYTYLHHDSIRPATRCRRHQRDREFARGRRRLRHEKHPADEAIATVIAGIGGGVAQSTPYTASPWTDGRVRGPATPC